MNRKKEFLQIVEENCQKLVSKYDLSDSIHNDIYFDYGMRVGMESVEEYLKRHYTFKPRIKNRKRKWKPTRRKRTKVHFAKR